MVFLSELLKREYFFIRNSEFYESLVNNKDEEEDEEEEEKNLDLDVCSYNCKDFKLYVKVLNFWGPREYPIEFNDLLLNISKEAKQNEINSTKELEMKREVLKEYIEVTNSERFKFYLEILNCKFNSDPLKINQIATIAASYGYLDFLFYCYTLKNGYEQEYKWDSYTCSASAGNGHLECLIFLHEKKCPWNTFTCGDAAKNGHLLCLKYAHENGCPWNSYILTVSISNNNFECFKYAIDNSSRYNIHDYNSILNSYVYDLIIELDKVDYLRYINTTIESKHRLNKNTLLTDIIINGSIKCLEYMFENYSSLFSDELCIIAAAHNKLESLIFLNDHGIKGDENVSYNAAVNGHLEILIYVHKNGLPWNFNTCKYSVQGDSIECLKYLHENGCQWDENTCIKASKYNNIECLIYAREHGCPWDIRVLVEASMYNNLECLEYAVLNKCPYYEKYKKALKNLKQLKPEKFIKRTKRQIDEMTFINWS